MVEYEKDRVHQTKLSRGYTDPRPVIKCDGRLLFDYDYDSRPFIR